MKYFDIYQHGKYVETVKFRSYEDAAKVYPAHFGWVIRSA